MPYQEEQILSFAKKMDAIVPGQITPDAYCRQYLQHLLQHRLFYLHIYAEVLQRLLQHTTLPKEALSLVDYGAGNGLLGLFARHCGFGTVYINDINSIFVDSARQLAVILHLDIEGYIPGDIHNVNEVLKSHPPHAIIGTDVIEHIYNLDDFFNQVTILNPAMITIFTTASNTSNPFKNKQLQQLQRKDEYEGGAPGDYALYGGATTPAFITLRKQIIASAFPELTAAELQLLVQHTRGLQKDDIINATAQYCTTKQLPPLLQHPTNTCDPITGSWTERLLTPAEYESIYSRAGFTCTFYNGFYNSWCGGTKGMLLKCANTAIQILGKYLAPFITLVGIPNKK